MFPSEAKVKNDERTKRLRENFDTMLILNVIAWVFAFYILNVIGWVSFIWASIVLVLNLSVCKNTTNEWVIIIYTLSTALGAIYLFFNAFKYRLFAMFWSLVISVIWGMFAFVCLLNLSKSKPVLLI